MLTYAPSCSAYVYVFFLIILDSSTQLNGGTSHARLLIMHINRSLYVDLTNYYTPVKASREQKQAK